METWIKVIEVETCVEWEADNCKTFFSVYQS